MPAYSKQLASDLQEEPELQPKQDSSVLRPEQRLPGRSVKRKTVWIDLDNSPHVPLFVPIVEELEKRGYRVVLTARDSYQVRELLDLHQLRCRVVGRHWGKNRVLKVMGTFGRALRLVSMMAWDRPDLAVSHVSRGQLLCSAVLRVPTLTMHDYEHTAMAGFVRPDWFLTPVYIPDSPVRKSKHPTLTYPGLKEDVYIPGFRPDASVRGQFGLAPEEILVTVRPPAVEAHYHNPETEVLFDASMKFLLENPLTRVVLLPRNERQAKALRSLWEKGIETAKILIPDHVVDGLNLIWFSDLVISGGGTMNREAAALGVPVYSIFRGTIGAVDRYLASQGRLTLIESADQVPAKIALVRRQRPEKPEEQDRPALRTIVSIIVSLVESGVPSEVAAAKTPAAEHLHS